MLFVCLVFAAFGLNMDNSYAVELNENSSEMEIGLDAEDTRNSKGVLSVITRWGCLSSDNGIC